MSLVKCTTAIENASYSVRVGEVVDTSSYVYARFPTHFSAEEVELDTLVAGAPTSAWTQTYTTAAKTVPDAPANLTLTATAIAAKTASTTLSDSGTADAAAVADSLNQAQKDLGTQINTIAADVLALKKNVTAIIDDLQSLGMFS